MNDLDEKEKRDFIDFFINLKRFEKEDIVSKLDCEMKISIFFMIANNI